MSREVFFIIGRGDAVLWSDASDSPAALPDSRARWEAIWAHRHEVELLVHSHPLGPHAFSEEDETTMAAVEQGVGQSLSWAVLSPQGLLVRDANRSERTVTETPWWVLLLSSVSAMAQRDSS